ncbi:MAG: membrane protein insertion efficiency factor YidD [Chlamydiales bacterium]|nr:membrane protein insertion efficiency factor YidD [Chlamydiales bacterium]
MKSLLLLALLSLSILAYAEEPWGCDADLSCRSHCRQIAATQPEIHNGPLERATRTLVTFHKKVVSPADGPRSHFKPSSSEYMLHAVEKHGFCYGFLLGCDRLMRENRDPWVYRTITGDYDQVTKWDPVR